MTDFIEGEDRTQSTLFPERLDDYITDIRRKDPPTLLESPTVLKRKSLDLHQ